MSRDPAVRDDRARIAADLHDTVIQRLFVTGLALQSVLAMVPNTEAARRLEAAIEEMDETIRAIRSAIFALDAPLVAQGGLRSHIQALIATTASGLGFEPRLRLDGPIDASITSDVSAHLLAVLREALANVALHANATHVEVAVTVRAARITLEVGDNGTGSGCYARVGGRGLRNLSHRAETLGGSMTCTAGIDGCGTRLTWQVPLIAGRTALNPQG